MENEKVFCKKVVYSAFAHDGSPSIILGLVDLYRNDDYIEITTRKGKHLVKREHVISISDTDEVFDGGKAASTF